MTLKYYLEFIFSYIRLVLIVAAIFATIGVIFSLITPPVYRASTTLAVRREAAEDNPDYFTYEGYYAQQTAQEYANTVVGFLESDDIALEALVFAGMPASTEQVKTAISRINVKKTAPNLVALTVDWDEATASAKVLNSLVAATKSRSQELNQKGDISIHVDPLAESPLVEERKPRVVLNSVVLALVGVLLSVVCLSFYLYLKIE